MNVPLSLQDWLKSWVFQGVKDGETLKRRCRFEQNPDAQSSPVNQNLMVWCADEETANRMNEVAIAKHLSEAAIKMDAPFVEVWIEGRSRPEYHYIPQSVLILEQQPRILKLPPSLVPGLSQAASIAIARQGDHVGVYCANIEQHCKAKKNDWLGKDMSRYHIPDQLGRLVSALETHGRINDFTYRALNFDLQEIELTVHAALVQYQGDLCRMVTVLNCALV